jgi:Mor family transcriptional regulator
MPNEIEGENTTAVLNMISAGTVNNMDFMTRLQITKEFKAGTSIRHLAAKHKIEGVKIESVIREFLGKIIA